MLVYVSNTFWSKIPKKAAIVNWSKVNTSAKNKWGKIPTALAPYVPPGLKNGSKILPQRNCLCQNKWARKPAK